MRYLGLPAQPTLHFWQPHLQITVAVSRPSARQEAAGRQFGKQNSTDINPQPL